MDYFAFENLQQNIKKSDIKKTKGQKFLRINRYMYDILKQQQEVTIPVEFEYRVDLFVQQLQQDYNYFWIFMRLNKYKIDLFEFIPFKDFQLVKYTIETRFKQLIDSIFPLGE